MMKAVKLILILFLGNASFSGVIFNLAYVIGLRKMLPKSGISGNWAFAPCAREYMLAKCAGREAEGRVYSVVKFFIILLDAALLFLSQEKLILYISIVLLALYLAEIVYSIRICAGLVEVYGAKRRWILLWVVQASIPTLIWGFSSSWQPLRKAEDIRNDALLMFSGVQAEEKGLGLTVNLEERSTIEFFQKKYLLRDIHMHIEPGRMVLLLGGSGAGKTTFLNAVNGYEKAKAKVVLNNRDVYAEYKKMQFEVGFVPQQDLMRDKDTVYRTLNDAALLRLPVNILPEDRKKRIEEVMGIFGLTPVKSELVEKLSGGQRKRLSIAMEFLSSPSLFILDEPDSGLDGVMARKLMENLRKIADQGKIVIVITHTPDRVADLFDDVIVLAKDSNRTGRLAFYGTIPEAQQFFGQEKMEKIILAINQKEEGGEGRADEFIGRYLEVQHA